MAPVSRPRGLPHEILIGEAGANLVLSKLQSWDMVTQPAMAGLAYDIVADIAGAGLVRIQVKTTTRLQRKRYAFLMKRGFYYSRQGNFGYESSDYDIAAFVCLPLARVCFCAAPIKRFSARPDWFMIEGIEWQTLQMAVPSLVQRDSLAIPAINPDYPIPIRHGVQHWPSGFGAEETLRLWRELHGSLPVTVQASPKPGQVSELPVDLDDVMDGFADMLEPGAAVSPPQDCAEMAAASLLRRAVDSHAQKFGQHDLIIVEVPTAKSVQPTSEVALAVLFGWKEVGDGPGGAKRSRHDDSRFRKYECDDHQNRKSHERLGQEVAADLLASKTVIIITYDPNTMLPPIGSKIGGPSLRASKYGCYLVCGTFDGGDRM